MQRAFVRPKPAALLFISVLAFVSLAFTPRLVGAQEVTTLTIHERICYSDQRFDDPFSNCHDNVFGQSTDWEILADDGYQSAMTDASTGNVTFSLPGTTAIIIDPWGADPYFYDYQYFCADTESGEPIAAHGVGQGASGGIAIEYTVGSNITCDWYLYAHQTESPTPTPVAPSTGPVTVLPSTGSGSSTTPDGVNLAFASAVLAIIVAAATCIALNRKDARC